jgi:hypothetical protein
LAVFALAATLVADFLLVTLGLVCFVALAAVLTDFFVLATVFRVAFIAVAVFSVRALADEGARAALCGSISATR